VLDFHPQVSSSNFGFHAGAICDDYVLRMKTSHYVLNSKMNPMAISLSPALTNLVNTLNLVRNQREPLDRQIDRNISSG